MSLKKKDKGEVDIKLAVEKASLEVGVDVTTGMVMYRHHVKELRKALIRRVFNKLRIPFLGAFSASDEELELANALAKGDFDKAKELRHEQREHISKDRQAREA